MIEPISQYLKNQFPEQYKENGPLLILFVQKYFEWLESKTLARDEYFCNKKSLVDIQSSSANVVGYGSLFTTQFANNDYIAICKGAEKEDYGIFQIDSVVNNTFLTLKSNNLPDYSLSKTRYGTVSPQANPLYLLRQFKDIQDIDNTFDEYVVYFKEKYLKNLQFNTITDTRKLIKHSLDLYRSKGTERSIDLLYKIVFGKSAKVYYPGQDLFRPSSGKWFIPRYLELSPSPLNKQLINKEIIGLISGAKAFIEEIIRTRSNNKIIEVAYISAINGIFLTGEKISLSNENLDVTQCPKIIGSLNEVVIETFGSGENFETNEIVDISSTNGSNAKGKVLTIANTVGSLDISFLDGGYGYTTNTVLANVIGTVSVNSSCTSITGTDTLFKRDFSNGDLISIFSADDDYETRQIISISSNTSLSINSAVTFSNTEAIAAYTRNFAQTFVSESILKIGNVTIDSDYSNFEYIKFSDEISQPLAFINYENSTNNFTVGSNIYTYDANNDQLGVGKILKVLKKTQTSGVLTVAVYDGDLEETNIYTSGNTISASESVSNGYVDTSASGKVIGNYANVTLICNSSSGSFIQGEEIFQSATLARGIVVGSSNTSDNIIINIKDSEGIFKNGFSVVGLTSEVDAMVTEMEIDIGIIDTNNTFLIETDNLIKTDYLQGTLISISNGSGADVDFSDTLLYTEEIEFINDLLIDFVDLDLDDTWPFRAEPSANLSTVIADAFSNSTLTIGKISGIVSSSPGTGYNRAPIIRVHEPDIFKFKIFDKYVLTVNTAAGFITNEVVTQESTDARGLILDISNNNLTIQSLRFYSNNQFEDDSDIIGSSSGFNANVVSIQERTQSKRLGSDLELLYGLSSVGGAITSIKIIDSGFGFVNDEVVEIVSGDKSANGTAVLETHGTGTGRYLSRGGFLSADQKLQDGKYWQEFSYEIRSSVIDDYRKILKNIIHVAGTAYFDALYYDSINQINTSVDSIITVT